jgi:hypothetical protein
VLLGLGVFGTFVDRESAMEAQQAIGAAGISMQKVSLSGYNSPQMSLLALKPCSLYEFDFDLRGNKFTACRCGNVKHIQAY